MGGPPAAAADGIAVGFIVKIAVDVGVDIPTEE